MTNFKIKDYDNGFRKVTWTSDRLHTKKELQQAFTDSKKIIKDYVKKDLGLQENFRMSGLERVLIMLDPTRIGITHDSLVSMKEWFTRYSDKDTRLEANFTYNTNN